MRIVAIMRPENEDLLRALHDAGHQIAVPMPLFEVMAGRGLGLEPIEWPGDPHTLPNYLGMTITEKLALQCRALPAIIHELNERAYDALIVWTDALPSTRVAVLTARKRGTPTFEVTHGALNTYRQGHFECDSYVDYILAPGEEEREFRRFYGARAEVIVTGKPSFDWISRCDKAAAREVIREQFGLPDKRPIVLYGLTWRHPFSTWERDSDWGERDVYAAHMNMGALCNPFLVVKPHYAASNQRTVARVKEDLERAGITEYAILGGPTQSILPAVDMVVSHKSSLLVEAVLLDLPAVGFDFRERNDFGFYAARGIEWCSKREGLLETMTRALLDAPTKQRLADERESAKHFFNGPNDGRATARCVAAVERLAGVHACAEEAVCQ